MQNHYSAPEGADILCNDDLINEYGLAVPINMVRLNRINYVVVQDNSQKP